MYQHLSAFSNKIHILKMYNICLHFCIDPINTWIMPAFADCWAVVFVYWLTMPEIVFLLFSFLSDPFRSEINYFEFIFEPMMPAQCRILSDLRSPTLNLFLNPWCLHNVGVCIGPVFGFRFITHVALDNLSLNPFFELVFDLRCVWVSTQHYWVAFGFPLHILVPIYGWVLILWSLFFWFEYFGPTNSGLSINTWLHWWLRL